MRRHEIKHDGFRLQVWRDGERVRPFTRRGFDWTRRYPRIVHSARAYRRGLMPIDYGETIPLRVWGKRCRCSTIIPNAGVSAPRKPARLRGR